MSFKEEYHHDCCSKGEERHHDHCKGCACERLKNLARNTPISFATFSSALLLPVTFISFDRKTCCVRFTLSSGGTTFDGFVHCKDIKTLIIT
ncbi:hypothetical protein ACFSCZ_13900 [Siminovitchia sediminis]|uniref:Uncharacterized protein n=1 Tax=Siminovitchia sediminis TaxID=1274353 RepID=A0ABW4KKG1_9BACI